MLFLRSFKAKGNQKEMTVFFRSLKIIVNVLILLVSVNKLEAQENIVINEFVSSNINGLIDIDSGEYPDWIELYNPTNAAVDISGYYLTDDIANSTKWQIPGGTVIPPSSYLIIWADDKNTGLHTNFKLDSDGEEIAIYSSSLTLIDSVIYDEQNDDISYGRDINQADNFLYFGEPTPGAANSTDGTQFNRISNKPTFSIESGFYTSALTVEIFSQGIGEIYYSTDGSIPTASTGNLYSTPIVIDSSSVINAIFIEVNSLPSKAAAQSYFINENTSLPVMSISTDPKNLWDDEVGIYTIGTNGLSFWGVNANYWQDWERPAKVDFFEEDKSIAFSVNAGIAINGARRNMLQKSLRIFARKKYGDDIINYKVFPDKEIRKFKSLILRNGGFPEFSYTMFRDGFIQNLISGEIDIESQSYKPCVLYLNGEYWGIFNIREKQNEEYLKDNKGVDPDNLDILERDRLVIEGDSIHYTNMLNFISANDLSVDENYDSVLQWIDVDNYIDYQIVEQYIANFDWPANNIKYWRPKTSTGKWRWLLFDVDAGYGLWAPYDYNSITFASADSSTGWSNPPWSTFLFRNLLKNQRFADEFVQRYAAYLSYSFNYSRALNLIEILKSKIESEIPDHINRWSPGCSISNPESKDGCVFESFAEWEENINSMKEFALHRPGYVTSHLMDYFSISDTINLVINSGTPESGFVYVNKVRARYQKEANLFAGKKVILEAKPKAGFRFLEWQGSISSNEIKIEIIPTQNLQIEAVFVPTGINVLPTIITADTELTKENSPYIVSNELYIYENAMLTINEGVELTMPSNSNIIVYGGLEILGTNDDPVLIRSIHADSTWGAISFMNASQKSKIYHAVITGATKGKDLIDQIGAISSYNSDIELNYVSLDRVQFPIFVQYGNFVMRNTSIHTNVTCDYTNVKYGSAIIENCEFIGNYAQDTDAIDYDDVKNGIIRRNIIYDFYGNNSDAIDIGEGAEEILIEDNLIYNCTDKGVSIGQASTAIVKGNIILDCNLGIGIKDEGSYGFVDHNTFYNNNISVSCYEKILGRGGGKAEITNTIFSQSISSDILADEFSEINVNYSLSDKELLAGEGNLFGDPEFQNPDSLDFRIAPSSPAINTGDPNYPLDPDGSRTNMGAYYYTALHSSYIVINEINYHSNTDFDPEDWLEFYNPNEEDVDLSNWIFKDEDDAHVYIFPEDAKILAGEYLVLCRDSAAFKNLFSNVNNVIGDFNFGLNNAGELIRLFDKYGNLIDSLTYDDEYPWPEDADGGGYTLQLTNAEFDNANVENWVSTIIFGTPGVKNITTEIEENIEVLPKSYSLSQNYPNPFNPSTTIKFEVPESANVTIKIYDILGREIRKLVDEKREAGSYVVNFNNKNLASGIYFYRMVANDFKKTMKMILLK